MGFIACGFNSSKHHCCVGWVFTMFDAIATIFAMISYFFFWMYVFSDAFYLDIAYFTLIGATIHICVAIFLFLHDIYFKSDTMIITGQGESTVGNITTVTSFGSIETNNSDHYETNSNCLNDNPWRLYRKHYIIISIKIIMLILDVAVLVVFNDGWKCVSEKC